VAGRLWFTPDCGGVGTYTASVFYDRVNGLAEGASATLPVLPAGNQRLEAGNEEAIAGTVRDSSLSPPP
jgi:hypothetical protein